jgi:hypothetical protein
MRKSRKKGLTEVTLIILETISEKIREKKTYASVEQGEREGAIRKGHEESAMRKEQ